jgi:hypothetical protein
MAPRNRNKSPENKGKKKPQQTPVNTNAAENVRAAFEQAEEDFQQDADLSLHSPKDDLDESETARLGGDKNDLA